MQPVAQPNPWKGHASPLARRYALVLSTLIAVLLIAYGAIELYFGWGRTIRDVRADQQRVAKEVAASIRLSLGVVERHLLAVAVLPWHRNGWLSPEQRREEFHRLLLLVPALEEIKLISANGKQQLRISRSAPDEISAEVFASTNASPTPQVAVGRPIYGETWYVGGYEPYVALKLAVLDRASNSIVATVSLRTLAFELRGALSLQDRSVYAIDNETNVVLHADPAAILNRKVSNSDHQTRGLTTILGLIPSDTFAVTATVPDMPWRVVVEQPAMEALAPVFGTLLRTAATTLVGVVLALIASSLLARHMTRPIASLHHGAQRLGQGHLDTRITLHTRDELEDLAHQFNRMAASLQESVAELEDKVAARTADLQRANQHKSEFLANMSHELRTPMNAILGFADVLREGMAGPLNDEQREYVTDIHASGLHLLALINDLLDLSRIESGLLQLEIVDFDVVETVESAAALERQRCAQKGLQLHVQVQPGLALWRADPRRVKQMLVNLLTNAVKFTPAGGRIDLRASRWRHPDTGQPSLCLEVQDTGIGIAAADHERAFEESVQVGHDAAARAEGSGLGLALVRRFARAHGGDVSLSSALGAGATFRVLLPHAPPTESDDAPAVEPAAEQANEQAGVRDVVQAVAAAHLNPGSPPP